MGEAMTAIRMLVATLITAVIIGVGVGGFMLVYVPGVPEPPPSCEEKASVRHRGCTDVYTRDADVIRACTELLVMDRARCEGMER